MKCLTAIKNIFFSIILLSMLTSCSVFGPVNSQPDATYVFKVNSYPSIQKSSHGRTLYVAPVNAEATYNTTQMAYSTKPYQVAYFAKNQWADTPAQMLQPILVQSLQNTHYFRVVSSIETGHYDYVLNSQLIELVQVFYAQGSEIHLKLRAQLVSASTNRVIAVKEFSIVERTSQRTPYGGVLATNRAIAVLMNQIARFCLQKI